MSKRLEITFEIERRFVIKRRSQEKAIVFCPFCQKNTEMFSTDEAALLIGCGSRAIFGWIELGWLHFIETSEGLVLICRQSLEKIINIK